MPSSPPSEPFVQSGDQLESFLRSFWQRQVTTAEEETPDFRHPPLPLARIKKVMKSDPDVRMIAADAPIIFCKACEIFIAEMTARAFIVADSNKRRTLSRSDIARAIAKSDQFDFLIDILPREDPIPSAPSYNSAGGSSKLRGKRKDDDLIRDNTVGPAEIPADMVDVDEPQVTAPQGQQVAENSGMMALHQLETLLSSAQDRPA
ncbi:histone-fold-containing protein [Hysterangium stoloniferum]|nr:histone-fold-containing protein [Hysterangium stoloniferum]